MKLSETFSYGGATVESVYALIVDQEFRTASCENQGAIEHQVTVDGGNVTVLRTMPAELPDFIKKLTGNTVKVKQTEQWTDPGDGTRVADVKVSIIGQPAEMLGRAVLKPVGDGTEFSVTGDVKVSIPFIGKKIEPEIAKAIITSLTEEVELGMTRL